MSLIPFPNVPNVPGVPILARSFTLPSAGMLLNRVLGNLAQSYFGSVVWGVFDKDGKEALVPDSFLDIDQKKTARVSNYPQQAGQFASYNKVITPYDCRLRMAIGSDKAGRTAFLKKIESMVESIELFSVITPEATYMNASLQNYNYRRDSANGVSLIVVDLWFIEVRLTAKAVSSNTATPSGSDAVSGGQVQGVTSAQVAAAGALA